MTSNKYKFIERDDLQSCFLKDILIASRKNLTNFRERVKKEYFVVNFGLLEYFIHPLWKTWIQLHLQIYTITLLY